MLLGKRRKLNLKVERRELKLIMKRIEISLRCKDDSPTKKKSHHNGKMSLTKKKSHHDGKMRNLITVENGGTMRALQN